MSSGTIYVLEVWSNSILINSQKLMTEQMGPHYAKTELRIEIQILNFNNS
jgi:hypothetical protein